MAISSSRKLVPNQLHTRTHILLRTAWAWDAQNDKEQEKGTKSKEHWNRKYAILILNFPYSIK